MDMLLFGASDVRGWLGGTCRRCIFSTAPLLQMKVRYYKSPLVYNKARNECYLCNYAHL